MNVDERDLFKFLLKQLVVMERELLKRIDANEHDLDKLLDEGFQRYMIAGYKRCLRELEEYILTQEEEQNGTSNQYRD